MSQTQTLGFSPEAEFITQRSVKERRQLLSSTVIGTDSVREELGEVFDECRYENWDGYGAKPVSNDTLRQAYIFLEALPLGCPPPSIGAAPRGGITFEWHRDRRHTLSLIINENGDLRYAALLGPASTHGAEYFFGDVPDIILELINRVIGA